jgi:hypothetical protein
VDVFALDALRCAGVILAFVLMKTWIGLKTDFNKTITDST